MPSAIQTMERVRVLYMNAHRDDASIAPTSLNLDQRPKIGCFYRYRTLLGKRDGGYQAFRRAQCGHLP